MQAGGDSARIGATVSRLEARRAEVNVAVLSVLRYMAGDLSLTEAAVRAELPRSVVTELSSEFAGFLLPRALRSVRSAKLQTRLRDGSGAR